MRATNDINGITSQCHRWIAQCIVSGQRYRMDLMPMANAAAHRRRHDCLCASDRTDLGACREFLRNRQAM
ncbi:hypothetical protein ASF73_08020 [Xanthomonas sp. Leaf131]|nr:hypothetical protein ASF73_08020 [Xanthomonas sp. Leaf131]